MTGELITVGWDLRHPSGNTVELHSLLPVIQAETTVM